MSTTVTLDQIKQQRTDIINDKKQITFLQHELLDYTSANGLTMLHKQHIQESLYTHAPTTLLPTPVNKTLFSKLTTLSTIWNKLIDGIARDETFITDALKDTIKVDDFTANLYKIYKQTQHNTIKQRYMLGIHRSDYMFHLDEQNNELSAQQVEINTIASSFGALSCKITALHTYLSQRYYSQHNWFLPKNETLHNIAHALIQAHTVYCKQQNIQPNTACILFVVQHNETNTTDQRDIEYAIFNTAGIHCIRRTFADIYNNSKLHNDTNILTIDNYEIAVTYYRAGYTPRDYTQQSDWDALLRIEQSITIKCPSTAYHLAGTKKIQQLCTDFSMLCKFLTDAEARVIQTVQAGMWGFEQIDSIQDTLNDVRNNVNDYVLKPQREGGGNNIWGNDIINILDTYTPEQLKQYILMKKINSLPINAALIRNGQITISDVISELGIYSTYLSDGTEQNIVVNQFAGHLLRTKTVDSNEGGVAAGFAVIDSPVLVL